jgi:hypothetical protein
VRNCYVASELLSITTDISANSRARPKAANGLVHQALTIIGKDCRPVAPISRNSWREPDIIRFRRNNFWRE